MSYAISIVPFFSVSLILALSCYLVLKAGEISFGQQAFFGIGAYSGAMLTAMFGWPLAPALAVSAAMGGLVAYLAGLGLVRTGGFRFALMTLVFGEFVKELFLQLRWVRVVDGRAVGPDGPLGFSGIDYFFANEISPLAQALVSLAVAALCTIAIAAYGRLAPGRRLKAVASDSGLAASLAINPVRTRMQAFAVAGAIAGLGGGLFAHHATYIDATNFSLMLGVHAVAYTLLGGLASVLGPIAGTAFDIIFLEGLRVVGGYRMVAFGGLIVLMLILRPRGLLAAPGGAGRA
jgi:branched-chain amino acid transport system permease protein